jgi:hypothetical protein
VDQSVDPPKMVCLRRQSGPSMPTHMVPPMVSDGRVKYSDDFDWEAATPQERAKGKTAVRQRNVRLRKKEEGRSVTQFSKTLIR